jgi:Glucose / Sorbosone dehydrogenase/Dockerin type I domain
MKFVCRFTQMRRFLLILLLASAANASTLPGFRVQLLQGVPEFITSLAVDSRGMLYYSVRSGDLYRFGAPETAAGSGTIVAHVPTHGEGNSGLIGLALRDDHTAVVHYTTPNQTYDVVSAIDLTTGAETELHRFICDITPGGEERGSSTEHHGGNLYAADDGSVFLGIGDYGVGWNAADPAWNAGKIWRILPDGSVVQFARGFRNPFDLAWDPATQRVIITDNGDVADDKIDVIAEGDDGGWPFTAGSRPAPPGTTPPVYTFPTVVAPTGLARLGGRNPILRSGFLLGSYVAKALFYIPNIYASPLPDPIAVVQNETDPIIDVVEAANGNVYFATFNAIFRLVVPMRGDCNGDGVVDAADLTALAKELADGPHPMTAAQNGTFRGSWGCDANGDGMIDSRDIAAVAAMVRGRAVRR